MAFCWRTLRSLKVVRIQDRNPSQCIGAIDNFFIVYRCHAQAPFDCGSRESGIAQSCAPESVALYISSHRTARKKTHVWWDVSREEATTISSVNMIIWQFIIYQSNNIQWYRVTWHRVTEPGTSQGGHEPRAEYRERERERETERERESEKWERLWPFPFIVLFDTISLPSMQVLEVTIALSGRPNGPWTFHMLCVLL